MNMAKLGIVSGAGIDFDGRKFLNKINKMRKSLYTLCVFDKGSTRNGWRHSFAVNISLVARICGRTRKTGTACFLSPTGVQYGQYGSYVIPVLSLMGEIQNQHIKPSSSLTACGFKRNSSLKNNCSTFAEGFAGGFCVPLKPNSQISGAASRPTREGVSASDFGQIALAVPAEGDTRPSEKAHSKEWFSNAGVSFKQLLGNAKNSP